MEHTGYSAPSSADVSLTSSGSSSANAVLAPTKKLRSTPAAPALFATMENIDQHNSGPTAKATITISIGSSVSRLSHASSQERNRRVALAKARQHTARLELEHAEEQARLRRDLARADEALTEEELDQALAGYQTGSVGRLAYVRSSEGNSAGAQRGASSDSLIDLEMPGQTQAALGLRVKTRSPADPTRATEGLIVKTGSQAAETREAEGLLFYADIWDSF